MRWICPPTRTLDRERVAVAPRVGTGHERPGFRVARDPLPASDDPRPVVDRVDVVSALREPGTRLRRDARLRVDQPIAIHAHPRRLDRLLDVHAELEHVEEHLRRGLEDPVRARRADGQAEDAVPEDLGRRHHNPGLPPGTYDVRRPGIASIHLRMLLSTIPVPGTAKPDPNGTPRV